MIDWLADAWDVHLHPGPDLPPRAEDFLATARAAAAAGMAGLVFKNHAWPTDAWARTAQAELPSARTRFVGAITLNASVGGWNAEAVAAALAGGARVVWAPTMSARHHATVWGRGAYPHPAAYAGLTALDDAGRVRPEVDVVLALIAEADAVLASGHLAPEESWRMFQRAAEVGVRRRVLTHASEAVTNLSAGQVREFAASGVWIEHCLAVLTPGFPGEMTAGALAERVAAVPEDRLVISSDLGQPKNGPICAGFARLLEDLHGAGVAAELLRRATTANPAALLFG